MVWNSVPVVLRDSACDIDSFKQLLTLPVWFSGNIVGRINEITLRRAALVLRWVTVRGYTVLVFNQTTQAHSAWPSLCG